MSYSNDQLREAVDAVFSQFDADNSQTLDRNELRNLLNAALGHMGAGREVTEEEVNGLLQATDSSGDGKITKQELYVIFEKVANA